MLYLVGMRRHHVRLPIAGLDVRHVEDIVDDRTLASLAQRYTPAELCFALKPHILRQTLLDGHDTAQYVDSDLRFYADPHVLTHELGQDKDVVLSPHVLTDLSYDGKRPRARAMLTSGAFNGGYLAVRRSAEGMRFLDWWGNAVFRLGRVQPSRGTHGDQRWLDLAPALFPTAAIIRNPGANVAYWNLHERELSRDDEGLKANGVPLVFFHFSGLDPQRADGISVFQDRFVAAPGSVLGSLFADYSDELSTARREFAAAETYDYERWWHGSGLLARWGRRARRVREDVSVARHGPVALPPPGPGRGPL